MGLHAFIVFFWIYAAFFGCILMALCAFSGVNLDFSGIGVSWLGYGWEIGIWADNCVVWHRILTCEAVQGMDGGGRAGKVCRYVYISFFGL